MINLQTLDPELSEGGDGAPLPKFPTGTKPLEWTQKRRVDIKNSFGFDGSNAAIFAKCFCELLILMVLIRTVCSILLILYSLGHINLLVR